MSIFFIHQKTTSMKTTKSLEEQHAQLLEKARSVGKKLALTNLPSIAQDENIEGYINGIRGGYSGLLVQEQRKHPANQNNLTEIEVRSSEQKNERLNNRLNEAKVKLRREYLELSEMDDDDARHVGTWKLWIGAFLLAFLESLFSYRAFSMLDFGNNVTLILLLVSLTVAFALLPKTLRWWYEEYTPESKYRLFLNIIPVVAIGFAFYVLGLLRAKFLSSQAAFSLDETASQVSFTVSPWYFMGINALLLLIGYFIAYQFPSSRQSKNKAILEKKEASIAKLENEVTQLEGELSIMPEREKNSLIRASNNTNGRKDTYIQVNNLFKEAIGAFIEANCTYRSDGQRPRCFDVSIADLEDHFI
jgi:hypothetical protein